MTAFAFAPESSRVADHWDLLEDGFQLASFIIPDRETALHIVCRAQQKLRAQHFRESKRAYWRDKFLKRKITKISRTEQDTLQWLICFEADVYLQNNSDAARASRAELVLQYVTKLAVTTCGMSFFHVNIGLHRLLYGYSTAEIQYVYEHLTNRFPGADEYRRAKRVIMKKLQQRFGSVLRAVQTQKGELKFEPDRNQAQWRPLVEQCLEKFSPWSADAMCPCEGRPSLQTFLQPFQSGQVSIVHQDEIETHWLHRVLHRSCHEAVIRKLSLAELATRLALPNLQAESGGADASPRMGGPRSAGPLTPEERKALIVSRDSEAGRAGHGESGPIRVMLDGVQRAQSASLSSCDIRFEIEEGDRLIEIWREEQGAAKLLAVHLIGYSEEQGIAEVCATFTLGEERSLVLTIAPLTGAKHDVRRATARLHQSGSGLILAILSRLRGADLLLPKWKEVTARSLAVLTVVAIGLFYYRTETAHPVLKQPSLWNRQLDESARSDQHLSQPNAGNTSYRLISDGLSVRGNGTESLPVIMEPQPKAILRLELPIRGGARRSYRVGIRPFMGGEEIFSKSSLTLEQTPGGSIVVVFVPSSILSGGTDYTADLAEIPRNGKPVIRDSFSFHVTQAR